MKREDFWTVFLVLLAARCSGFGDTGKMLIGPHAIQAETLRSITVLEALAILEARPWSARKETSTRQKLERPWICWNAMFAPNG